MRTVGLFAFAAAFAVYACSSTAASPSDAGTDGSTSSDAGTDALLSSGCPASQPAEGTICYESAYCEYGGNAKHACTTTAECIADTAGKSATWHLHAPDASCGVNSASCPASFAAIVQGSACTTSAANAACDYNEGRCGCVACGDGSTSEGVWSCRAWESSAGTPGCPSPRPLLGTSCTAAQESLQCSYDSCCSRVSVGPSMRCENGAWRVSADTNCACIALQCADAGSPVDASTD